MISVKLPKMIQRANRSWRPLIRNHKMKIAILINEDTASRCTGKGCLKAFFDRTDAFSNHPEDTELVGFFHIGGDLERKIERLIENRVDTVHLSSCLRSKYEGYEDLARELSRYFNVIGYTHGSEEGRTKRALRLNRLSAEDCAPAHVESAD